MKKTRPTRRTDLGVVETHVFVQGLVLVDGALQQALGRVVGARARLHRQIVALRRPDRNTADVLR